MTPGDLMARAFGWAEVFLLIPLHAFWMLYKSTPFIAENTPSALVAAVPLGAMMVVGLAGQLRGFRAAIIGAEGLCHLTAAACMAVVLLTVALNDPFDPIVPITWPLCFWSIAVAFAMLSNLALHERMRRYRIDTASWGGWAAAVGTALALWIALVWIAASMTWAPYFLTVSVAFHSIMARSARRAHRGEGNRIVARGRRGEGATSFVEGMFAVALMLTALLRFLFECHMTGTAELKYFQFVDIGTHPWFAVGVVLALVASRFRFGFVIHALTLGVLLLSDAISARVWEGFSMQTIALAMGYGLPVLFLASRRVGTLAYALSTTAATTMWILGMLSFTLAGVIIVFEVGLDFARDLAANMRVLALVLCVLFLALTGRRLWRTGAEASPEPRQERSISGLACGVTYVVMWILVLGPIVYLVKTAMWPPIWFERPARVEVGEPAGVCHAGKSRSDEEYAVLDKLGVRIMRVDYHWKSIQPGPDTWDFDHFDRYTASANKHKVNVLALLVFDNKAVERSPSGSKRDKYIAPEDIPLFLEYVRRTVGRYKDKVYAWEIWNEPDMPRFWTGTAEEFYELARRTAQTVREVHPEALLLGTAMTSGVGAYSAKEVEGMHTSGALKEVDHPTMHTYITDPRGYYNEFRRVQNAAAKHGHPGSVWITELGDPDGGVYPWRASSDLLAEHATKAYTIATSMGIEKLIWYCYEDSGLDSQRKDPDNSEASFGLVGPGGQWKPAAHAYSLFAKNCSNSVIRTDLLDVSGGIAARQLRTALYRRDGGESVLIMWFEPGLRPGAHARVTLDLGQLKDPAVMHDITSGYTKHLLDDVVDVTEKPLFITYKVPSPETPARLYADSSPADEAWLMAVVGLVLWAAWGSLSARRTDCAPAC